MLLVTYLEEDTRVGIYIWPWVLGFTLFQENIWNKFVDLSDQFEELVIWEMLESKFTLASVSWIGLSEDGMTVTWDDTSTLE